MIAPRGIGARPGPILGSVFLVLLAVALAACGPSGPSSATPGASASPDVSAGSPGPKPTTWPTTTIEAAIALGAADTEIWRAGVDLRKAAETEDLELMWGAADGLVKLVDGISANVPRLQSYPHLAPLGDQLEVAYAGLRSAAVRIRDSITGGDPDGLVAGFGELTAAIELYSAARPGLSDAAGQAVFMKRTLVR